jgi:hypothetical protein
MKSALYEKMNKSARRCTYRNAGCLLKNRSTKHSKYVINQKLEYVGDISFRELFGRIGFCLFVCLFLFVCCKIRFVFT